MEYILCYQTHYDYIKYLIPGLDRPASLPYKKFLDYVYSEMQIKDHAGFLRAIDSFETLYITEDGNVTTITQEGEQLSPDFLTMIKLKYVENQEKQTGATKTDAVTNSIKRATVTMHDKFRQDKHKRF